MKKSILANNIKSILHVNKINNIFKLKYISCLWKQFERLTPEINDLWGYHVKYPLYVKNILNITCNVCKKVTCVHLRFLDKGYFINSPPGLMFSRENKRNPAEAMSFSVSFASRIESGLKLKATRGKHRPTFRPPPPQAMLSHKTHVHFIMLNLWRERKRKKNLYCSTET